MPKMTIIDSQFTYSKQHLAFGTGEFISLCDYQEISLICTPLSSHYPTLRVLCLDYPIIVVRELARGRNTLIGSGRIEPSQTRTNWEEEEGGLRPRLQLRRNRGNRKSEAKRR